MKIIAFITGYQPIERIITHLKLTFVAAKPPPPHVFEQVALTAAEEGGEYFRVFRDQEGEEVYRLLVGVVSFFPNMRSGAGIRRVAEKETPTP